VATAVGSQAAGLVAASALIAIPAGVLVGRWSWNFFADRVGALAVPIVPAIQVVVVVAGGLLIALGVAAGPARAASRVKPAVIFRVE
jgi:ABC-type lipoprotein release transport system permease subunit